MSLHLALLLGLLAGNVLLRFFTNALNVLPRFLNLWDIGMTLAIALVALCARQREELPIDMGRWLRRLLAFNVVCCVGSLLNIDYVYFEPALSQLIMWNEPIVLFLALLSLPFSKADVGKFWKLLIFLVCLQLGIGALQVPVFLRTGASESIIGTFSGNAEQYQYFILLSVFYCTGKLEVNPVNRTRHFVVIFLVLVLVVLIDNKASWIALALTLGILMPRLPGIRGRVSGKLKRYALFGFILFCGYGTAKLASATAANKFGALMEALSSGEIANLGKIKAVRDVLSAYSGHPQMALVGAGLGTFYSRAAFQYFPFHIREIYDSEAVAAGSGGDSASMSGVIDVVSKGKPFYKTFFDYQKIHAVGSGTADFPTSSYISLLGESGLLGTFLYLSFYVWALRLAKQAMGDMRMDSVGFPFAVLAFAGLIYLMLMGCYNYWLDCGRVNTILWAMLALSLRRAVLVREQEAAEFAESEASVGDSAQHSADHILLPSP